MNWPETFARAGTALLVLLFASTLTLLYAEWAGNIIGRLLARKRATLRADVQRLTGGSDALPRTRHPAASRLTGQKDQA